MDRTSKYVLGREQIEELRQTMESLVVHLTIPSGGAVGGSGRDRGGWDDHGGWWEYEKKLCPGKRKPGDDLKIAAVKRIAKARLLVSLGTFYWAIQRQHDRAQNITK